MGFWSVPRIWGGETAFLVAGGPSLQHIDLAALAGRNVVAVNDSYLLCPWAPVLYFCDRRWFDWHEKRSEFRAFRGIKVTLDEDVLRRRDDIRGVKNTGTTGLERQPWGVRTGRNSGYQAINLAVHFGARRIVLLGYDMRVVDGRTHWHHGHPVEARPTLYESCMLPNFPTLVEPLAELGVEVVNATPGSALTTFPAVDLGDILADH
jgi:hypothetical protein